MGCCLLVLLCLFGCWLCHVVAWRAVFVLLVLSVAIRAVLVQAVLAWRWLCCCRAACAVAAPVVFSWRVRLCARPCAACMAYGVALFCPVRLRTLLNAPTHIPWPAPYAYTGVMSVSPGRRADASGRETAAARIER